MPKKTKMIKYTFYLTAQQKEALAKIAWKTGFSISELIRQSIQERLDRKEK